MWFEGGQRVLCSFGNSDLTQYMHQVEFASACRNSPLFVPKHTHITEPFFHRSHLLRPHENSARSWVSSMIQDGSAQELDSVDIPTCHCEFAAVPFGAAAHSFGTTDLRDFGVAAYSSLGKACFTYPHTHTHTFNCREQEGVDVLLPLGTTSPDQTAFLWNSLSFLWQNIRENNNNHNHNKLVVVTKLGVWSFPACGI